MRISDWSSDVCSSDLLDGAVGGALTSTLNARFALQTIQQGSGPQTNYVTGNRIGKVDRTNGRLQLQWEANDAITMLLNPHKGYDRSDTALYKADTVLTVDEDVYADQARVAGPGIGPRMELESADASLTVNWTLAQRLSLTSI